MQKERKEGKAAVSVDYVGSFESIKNMFFISDYYTFIKCKSRLNRLNSYECYI